MRRTLLSSAAALLGIAVTAAVAWSASQLAAQRIGLSSAPLSVANGLAPAPARATGHPPPRAHPVRSRHHTRPSVSSRQARPSTTSTRVPAPAPAPAPSPTTTAASATVTRSAPTTTAAAPRRAHHHSREDSGGGSSSGTGGGRDD